VPFFVPTKEGLQFFMVYHHENPYQIYFGTRTDNVTTDFYLNLDPTRSLAQLAPFTNVHTNLNVSILLFAHQAHGTQGHAITKQNARTLRPFHFEGDYLITAERSLGLGVMSADCLPLLIVDQKTPAVGIAHAGWRGSFAGIAITMLNDMQQQYKTDPTQVRIFFGPAAKACCYQVGPDLVDQLSPAAMSASVHQKNNLFFFDLALFNTHLLCQQGVAPTAMNFDYNACTLCDGRFFSYRAHKTNQRQMTVITLI